MKQKSTICIILALAMVLMGTGYAYWAETLNVTTRATTGNMDVTFVDLGLYAQYNNERGDNYWSLVDGIGESGYVPADFFERGDSNYNIIAREGSIDEYLDRAKGFNNIDFDGELVDPDKIPVSIDGYSAGQVDGSDNILLTVNNIYPGYAQAFRSDIVNIGTLAAKLAGVGFEVSELDGSEVTPEVKDMLGIAVLVEREYQSNGEEGSDMFKLAASLSHLPDTAFFEIGNVKFVRLSMVENVGMLEAIAEANLLCLPNTNRMDLYLGIGMDPDATGMYTSGTAALMADNDDTLSQNMGLQVSVDLLWDQFNVGSNADAGNWLEQQNQ